LHSPRDCATKPIFVLFFNNLGHQTRSEVKKKL
ncbi:hypothetical protein T11_15560, partial [Trichinella zimbabwensis]